MLGKTYSRESSNEEIRFISDFDDPSTASSESANITSSEDNVNPAIANLERNKLWEVFKAFDTYGNDKVLLKDVTEVLRIVCQYPMEDDMRSIEENFIKRNELDELDMDYFQITFTEFIDIYDQIKRPQGEWFEMLNRALKTLDKYNTGLINKEEMLKVIDEFGDKNGDPDELKEIASAFPTQENEKGYIKITDIISILMQEIPSKPKVPNQKSVDKKKPRLVTKKKSYTKK